MFSPRQLAALVVATSFAAGLNLYATVAVPPSPEPFSNIALSLGEDAVAVFIVWLASRHPFWAAAIAATLIVIIIALARAVVRALRGVFRGAERQLTSA